MIFSQRAFRGGGIAGLVWLGLAGATLASAQMAEKPTVLEAVKVSEQKVPGENKAVGTYFQPEWTARRRFVTTRVYVQPEEQAELELGYEVARDPDGFRTHLFRQELEYGLPRRWQINLENTQQDFVAGVPGTGKWHHDSTAVELRHALADWDKLPLNPTLSVAWKANAGAADAWELQLLLGGEFTTRWHWGVNFFNEQQMGGDRVRERAVSGALGYTVLNEKLGIGLEAKYSEQSDKKPRATPERRLSLGPSIQWRPSDRTHFDVVPMWGGTKEANRFEVFVFFGFEFGDGSDDGDDKKVEPASLRGR